MSDTSIELNLEQMTCWHRASMYSNNKKLTITEAHEMDQWCRERFQSDTYFRFGNSFFFEDNGDKVMFMLVWGK